MRSQLGWGGGACQEKSVSLSVLICPKLSLSVLNCPIEFFRKKPVLSSCAMAGLIERMGLGEECVRLFEDGYKYPQIAEALVQKYPEKLPDGISVATICRFLKDVRREKRERTSCIVEDFLGRNLPTDIECLNEIQVFFMQIMRDGAQAIPTRGNAGREASRIIDIKLKYSISNDKLGSEDIDDLITRELERLKQFKEEVKELPEE